MQCIDIHHVGVWTDNMDEMISFLTGVMGFRLLTRAPRGAIGPGERALIHAGGSQLFEVLTEPNVTPRPDFAPHPLGHAVGIPHLCLRVTDIPAWRERLEAAGYPVVGHFPESGFTATELGRLRLIFFVGPGGIGFELFEFEEEHPLPGTGTAR